MAGIITNPALVEPTPTTCRKPGAVRYVAPELLNPKQFSLKHENGSPSKESDVYSLVMTAYEVSSSWIVHCYC